MFIARQLDRLPIEAVTQCRPPLRQQRVKYPRLRNVGAGLHRHPDRTRPVTHPGTVTRARTGRYMNRISGTGLVCRPAAMLRPMRPPGPRNLLTRVDRKLNGVRTAFNGSRIREYVPLFVERRARAALTELAV